MNRKSLLIKILLLGLAYFVTARAGLELNSVSGFATFVWPPTGIALAALLIFDYSLWPGIFLGAFFANFVTGAPILTSSAIGAGNTLEALTGVFLLHKVGFSLKFEHLRDILLFVGLGAFLSTLVSATIGSSALWLSGIVNLSTIGPTWITWWIGDVLGALIVGSLIICLRNLYFIRKDILNNKKRIAEVGVLCSLIVLVDSFTFFSKNSFNIGMSSLIYLVFALLVWAAL